MTTALGDMLKDKSVLTAIVAVLIALGAKFGLELDTATVASFVGVFAAAILKQAAESHGSDAATTAAASVQPPQPLQGMIGTKS